MKTATGYQINEQLPAADLLQGMEALSSVNI
jgi:hypothetical protein